MQISQSAVDRDGSQPIVVELHRQMSVVALERHDSTTIPPPFVDPADIIKSGPAKPSPFPIQVSSLYLVKEPHTNEIFEARAVERISTGSSERARFQLLPAPATTDVFVTLPATDDSRIFFLYPESARGGVGPGSEAFVSNWVSDQIAQDYVPLVSEVMMAQGVGLTVASTCISLALNRVQEPARRATFGLAPLPAGGHGVVGAPDVDVDVDVDVGPTFGAMPDYNRIKSFFAAVDHDDSGDICKEEFRRALVLHGVEFSDDVFSRVFAKFDVDGSNKIQLDEILFLLGRGHAINPEKDISLVFIEAVQEIANRAQVKAGEIDDSQLDATTAEHVVVGADRMGCGAACKISVKSHIWILLNQAGCIVFLALMILSAPDPDWYWILLFCLLEVVYLGTAFKRDTSGYLTRVASGVMGLIDRHQQNCNADPSYKWTVQCWHFETRTYTDSNGNRSEKRVRVNTHSAKHSGKVPSADNSPKLVPDTRYKITQFHSKCELEWTNSNYHDKYNTWCHFHKRDSRQEISRKEWVEGHDQNTLVEWVPGTRPFWMSKPCWTLAILTYLTIPFRLLFDAVCGRQLFTYKKQCQNL